MYDPSWIFRFEFFNLITCNGEQIMFRCGCCCLCVCVCVVHDVRASLPGSLIRHLKSVLQPDRQNKTENIYRKCNFVYVQSMEKQYGDEWRKHYDDVLLNL